MSPVRKPEATRMKILESALDLFHRGSFTGTSINQIVEKAGITKGALFHYFRGKIELGYAVVDEVLKGHIVEIWVTPLATSTDPVKDISGIMEGLQKELHECPEMLELGCPLNNLAQELSSLDDGFRQKLLELYRAWEEALEKALRTGIDAGNVRSDVDPKAAAVTLVALLEGSIGMIKVHQDLEQMGHLGNGIHYFLHCLRP